MSDPLDFGQAPGATVSSQKPASLAARLEGYVLNAVVFLILLSLGVRDR